MIQRREYTGAQSWLDCLEVIPPRQKFEVIRCTRRLARLLYEGKVDMIGSPLLQHALGSTAILVSMHMDHESIAAAILHTVPEYLDGLSKNDWAESLSKISAAM